MLKIETNIAHVKFEMQGKCKTLNLEMIATVHAYFNALRDTKPEAAAEFHQALRRILDDPEMWAIGPKTLETVIEVDRPEDLWEADE